MNEGGEEEGFEILLLNPPSLMIAAGQTDQDLIPTNLIMTTKITKKNWKNLTSESSLIISGKWSKKPTKKDEESQY